MRLLPIAPNMGRSPLYTSLNCIMGIMTLLAPLLTGPDAIAIALASIRATPVGVPPAVTGPDPNDAVMPKLGATVELPEAVGNAVLEAIQDQFGVNVSANDIIQAEPRIWSDGCLGLGPVGEICSEVFVRGWQVTVRYQRQHWVYRTNRSGQLVKWDQASTELGKLLSLQSVSLPPELSLPRFPQKTVFRSISTGSIAGKPQTTVLLKDGRIVRFPGTEELPKDVQSLRQVSKAEVKQFKQLLHQHHFGQFHLLCYLPPEGAADFLTVILSSKNVTMCTTDLNLPQHPEDLKAILQAWEQLTTRP